MLNIADSIPRTAPTRTIRSPGWLDLEATPQDVHLRQRLLFDRLLGEGGNCGFGQDSAHKTHHRFALGGCLLFMRQAVVSTEPSRLAKPFLGRTLRVSTGSQRVSAGLGRRCSVRLVRKVWGEGSETPWFRDPGTKPLG